jgi:hypothetical protein
LPEILHCRLRPLEERCINVRAPGANTLKSNTIQRAGGGRGCI